MDSSTNSSGVIAVDELPRDNVTATMTVNWMGGDEPLASNCRVLRERFTHIYPVDSWKAEGFFTDEDLLDIGCHWLKYEPVRQSIHFSLAIAYAVLFIIGFTSNLLVVYIILSSKKLLTPANILLVNLALSDLLTVSMVPIFIFNSFHQGPAIGKWGCFAYGFLTGHSGTCSIMSLAAIAVDRYLVISRPFDLAKKPTRSWAYVTVVLIWIYSAAFASMPLFGVGRYVPEGYLTSCSFDYLSEDWTTRVFVLSFFLGAWVVPLAIITVCYAAIVRAVIYVRHCVIVAGGPGAVRSGGSNLQSSSDHPNCAGTTSNVTNDPEHKGIHQPNVEVAIAKIVIGLIGTWMIAWTPYALVALAGISGYAYLVTPLASMAPALFAKTAACIDPFIYSLNHPKIRREILQRLFRRFFPGSVTSATGAIAGSRRIESCHGGRNNDSTMLVVNRCSAMPTDDSHPSASLLIVNDPLGSSAMPNATNILRPPRLFEDDLQDNENRIQHLQFIDRAATVKKIAKQSASINGESDVTNCHNHGTRAVDSKATVDKTTIKQTDCHIMRQLRHQASLHQVHQPPICEAPNGNGSAPGVFTLSSPL